MNQEVKEKEEVKEVKETIEIGGQIYDKDSLTPTVYFNYVKDMKKNIADENLQAVAENCLALLKKTQITGQTSAAKKIVDQYSLIMRELKAASFGFDTIVYKSDIEKFITKIADKPVKIIELENYTREVDDSVIDKLVLAKENELFDEYYVVFTDYSLEQTKKVAKERRDKDPILFGAFKSEDKNNIPQSRFFYIGDWVDEYCDLTLEEMLTKYENAESVGAKYTIDIPRDVNELKEYMGMLEKKDEKKAETILSKIKKTVKRGSSKKSNTKKKKSGDK